MQVTQQIFVAEKWAKKAREDLHNEVQSGHIAERATGDLKKEIDSLNHEVKEAKGGRDSAEASLQNATKQAEDLRQQLHQSKEDLRAEKQAVSNLKAELAKVKGKARLAREAAEKAVAASYERGVSDTEVRLAEEVATVCREYIIQSWGVALDRAAVSADFDLRKIKNVFFPEDVRETPNEAATEAPPPSKAPAPDSTVLETEDA